MLTLFFFLIVFILESGMLLPSIAGEDKKGKERRMEGDSTYDISQCIFEWLWSNFRFQAV